VQLCLTAITISTVTLVEPSDVIYYNTYSCCDVLRYPFPESLVQPKLRLKLYTEAEWGKNGDFSTSMPSLQLRIYTLSLNGNCINNESMSKRLKTLDGLRIGDVCICVACYVTLTRDSILLVILLFNFLAYTLEVGDSTRSFHSDVKKRY